MKAVQVQNNQRRFAQLLMMISQIDSGNVFMEIMDVRRTKKPNLT